MSLEALRAEIDATADLPLEEATPIVATALNGQPLLVPIESYDEATGEMQLITGNDAEGNTWLYAYTGEDIMQAVGLDGQQCVHFEFLGLIRMAAKAPFAGIVIDLANGSTRAHIPDYWFEEIERVLGGA